LNDTHLGGYDHVTHVFSALERTHSIYREDIITKHTLVDDVTHVLELGVSKIRCNFDEERRLRALSVACFYHGRHEICELLFALQIPQPGSVGGRNVDNHHVGDVLELFDFINIVRNDKWLQQFRSCPD